MLFNKLPQERWFQIFVRVPIQDLVRCAFTCKTLFEYIITNPYFLEARTRKNTPLILYGYKNMEDRQFYSLQPDNYNDNCDVDNCDVSQQYVPVPIPMPIQGASHRAVNFVGSVNGVICLSDDLHGTGYSIDLWNPCICKIVRLPQPRLIECSTIVVGFGHELLNDEYKVVRFGYDVDPFAEVYSTKTGSWKWICQGPPSCRIRPPERRVSSYSQCYVRGACHWPGWKEAEIMSGWKQGEIMPCWSSIVTFSMKDEVFGEIKLPPRLEGRDVARNDLMLAPMGTDHTTSKLALMQLFSENSNLFVMKKYGVVESWYHAFRIPKTVFEVPRSVSFSFRKDLTLLVLSVSFCFGGGYTELELANVVSVNGEGGGDVRSLQGRFQGKPLAAFLCSYVESFGLISVKKEAPGSIQGAQRCPGSDFKRRKLN